MSLIAVAATSAQAQPAKRYPVQDFFKKPQQTAFRLSPGGKRIAFMPPFESRMNVFVQPIEKVGTKDDIKRVTSETARDISGFFFKSPSEGFYAIDFGGDENFHVVAVDVTSGVARDLTPHKGTRASILGALEDDDAHILVTHNKRDKKVFDVYRINVKTGVDTLAAQNPGNFTEWVTDHAGKIRGATSADGVNTSLFYRETEADAFKSIVTTNFREQVSPVGWTADNTRMYVSSNRGRDKSALFEFDPKTGKEGKLIFEHPDVDVSTLGWSRARKVMLYTAVNADKTVPVFFDRETERIYTSLKAKLGDTELSFSGATKDEQSFIVASFNDRTPRTRYLYDVKADKLTKLAEINPALDAYDLWRELRRICDADGHYQNA